MIHLYFVPSKLPRTWTKTQWKEAYRWVRITQKQLTKVHEKQLECFSIYGSTMPKQMRDDFMDQMVYPPLFLGPGMDT